MLDLDTGVKVKSWTHRPREDLVKIGELAERSGVSARMLRYYEQQHLLEPVRAPNGYRDYSAAHVDRVQRIRGLLQAGLPTRFVRAVLDMGLAPDEPGLPGWTPTCTATFAAQLRTELVRIEEQLRCLDRSRETVRRYLEAVSVVDDARAATG